MTGDDTEKPQGFPRAPGDDDLGGFIAGLTPGRRIAIGLEGERWDAAACEMIGALDTRLCLDSFSARGARIGDPGMAALTRGTALRAIRRLGIERCGVSDAGVGSLMRSGPFDTLAYLSLCNREGIETGRPNQIGDASAIALAATWNLPALEDLDLWNTRVGDLGFDAIATSDRLPVLDSVYAWGTRLTADGAARIKEIAAENCRKREALGSRPFRWRTYHTDHDRRTISWTDNVG